MICKQTFRASPKFKCPFSVNIFSNIFFMKTAKDFQDGHIWFSVINRPPCSTFTRVQRVSCCFSLLLCTMLTSIMFWGIPTDPSEQTMDLGRKHQHDTKWTTQSRAKYCTTLYIIYRLSEKVKKTVALTMSCKA